MIIDYTVDYTELDSDDFTVWSDCVYEVCLSKGDISVNDVHRRFDVYSELYHESICELYHYEMLKKNKALGIGKLEVFEVTSDGTLNQYKSYANRNHLRMDIAKILKLDSAFAINNQGIGYVIHGNINACKEQLNSLSELIRSK
jgi:hypothetical protein